MISWLLLGGALLLVPPVRTTVVDGGGAPVPVRRLQVIAAAAVAVAAVLALGATAGLAVAPVLAAGAWLGVGRLHARPPRLRPDAGLPLALDLVAAALQAGQPIARALALAAPAAGERSAAALLRVSRLLALGADPSEAWQPLADDPVLGEVAAAARRSASSGVRLAAAFTQTADDLRAAACSVAEARAQRVGVLAAAPLGLCFLPAFVCLAIVPVVVGIASSALGSAR